MGGVNGDTEEINKREEEKKLNIATLRKKIAKLEALANSVEKETQAVGPDQMQTARRSVEMANKAWQEKIIVRNGVACRLKVCIARKNSLQREIGQLKDKERVALGEVQLATKQAEESQLFEQFHQVRWCLLNCIPNIFKRG